MPGRAAEAEGDEDRTLLSWVGSQLVLLLHGPKRGDRRWHWATSCPARAKLLGQNTRHFLAWLRVWGLGGGPGATFQLPFQLLLDNLSISCLGCKSQPFPSRPPPASARCLALR